MKRRGKNFTRLVLTNLPDRAWAAVLTVLYALSTAMDRDLFFTAVPHPLGSAFSIMYLVTRWLFPLLTLVCVVYGIRRVGLEGEQKMFHVEHFTRSGSRAVAGSMSCP